jgi:hypothetical protein
MRAGIAGVAGGSVVVSVRIGRSAVAAARRVLAAIIRRFHRMVGRWLAPGETGCLAGVDEQRFGPQRRANLDSPFVHVDDRFAGRVDFDVVLRPAHREQRAGRLHDARLGASDLVEHRVDPSALKISNFARCGSAAMSAYENQPV